MLVTRERWGSDSIASGREQQGGDASWEQVGEQEVGFIVFKVGSEWERHRGE